MGPSDSGADSGAADSQARPLASALSEALERLVAEGQVRVQENGAWLASLDGFRYEVRRSGDTPLLHLWSEERDLVRRVLRINEEDSGRLKLQVSRLGHSRPEVLEFLAGQTARNSKRAARERFCARFRDLLCEKFPDESPLSLTTAANLRYSLSGNYARGLLAAGSGAWAVLGAAPGESAATYDALLDFGLLWLDRARQSANRRRILGLRLFSPQGADRVTVNRLQALQSDTAVELYEYNPDTWRLRALDLRDVGNLDSSLVAHRDTESALARAAADIERVRRLSPNAIEAQAIPGTRDVALRFRGVLLARSKPQGLFFGLGEMQQPLTAENEEELVRLVAELETHRAPVPESTRHPLYRAQPERWLQSMVMADPTRVDARLDPRFLYAQVPAFAAGDRGVLDLLGVTRTGRLAVLELKANEDLHLVWQGVDYWLRVRWHHQRQDFPRYGYFPGIELDPRPPLLFLVAPSLRFHPATNTLLRFLKKDIEVARVGFSESWRRGLKVVLREGT